MEDTKKILDSLLEDIDKWIGEIGTVTSVRSFPETQFQIDRLRSWYDLICSIEQDPGKSYLARIAIKFQADELDRIYKTFVGWNTKRSEIWDEYVKNLRDEGLQYKIAEILRSFNNLLEQLYDLMRFSLLYEGLYEYLSPNLKEQYDPVIEVELAKLRGMTEQADDYNAIFKEREEAATEIMEKMDDGFSKIVEKQKDIERIHADLLKAYKEGMTIILGKHFSTQYQEAKRIPKYWLIAAGVLLSIGIGTAAFFIFSPLFSVGYVSKEISIFEWLSRLTVITLCFASAYFCSLQYTKQKLIIEDYAHKNILALSLKTFSEEIKSASPDSMGGYLNSVLKQLHKSPVSHLTKKPAHEDNLLSETMGLLKETLVEIRKK